VTVGGNQTGDLKNTAQILYLPCHKLLDHRLHFNFYLQSHLEGLVSSIREAGLLEPIVVTPTEGAYRILSGHYRIRAVRRLKWKQVLCRVVECDDRLAAVIYCTSNLLTRGVSAMEEAYMISGLIAEENFTMAEIGNLWGRSKSWVSRRLSLLTHLDRNMKKELAQGFLQPRVAQELARLPQGNEQARVLKLIRREHLSKDSAAELISWWLTAGENERKVVEQKGFLKDKAAICGADYLARHVSKQLADCTRRLSGLVSIVSGQKEMPWWPHQAYQSFKAMNIKLEDALKEQQHPVGVGK
jgi:ParB/RepB/Spo0J family partition protein